MREVGLDVVVVSSVVPVSEHLPLEGRCCTGKYWPPTCWDPIRYPHH